MRMATRSLGLMLLLLLASAGGCAKKHPTSFVLDTEQVLTVAQQHMLDSLYRAHELRTGNEIALVTHPNFNGRSPVDFAIAFGDSVGVGKKEHDNGVVIAYSKARREVFIATGMGTEHVLHDSICKRIIDMEMIPRFKADDAFGGLWAGSIALVNFLDKPENAIH